MALVLYRREWGSGAPVIAMHPLGLESSGFAGFGSVLAQRGLRTIAVDLPGFGRTPLPDQPPTPAVMAEPVIALARSLPEPPVVLGISMGGRVALEAVLTDPAAFRGVVAIAPFLPWRRFRFLMDRAWMIDPRLADWMPFEHAWPVLRWLARGLETLPYVRDDEIAQAGARLVYYASCPATRTAFIAAARELALDQPYGPRGLWTRLPGIALPAAIVWGERDQLVSLAFSRPVARQCPAISQFLLPCVGHWLNGPHHRCLAAAVAGLVTGMLQDAPPETGLVHSSGVRFGTRECLLAPTETTPRAVLEERHHGT